MESVVRDKVAEFQTQLDRAQAVMQVELENTRRLNRRGGPQATAGFS
uniref:Intracellular protein transport protein uso1 isoform x3 n=1 Tax=Triatoma infestans TaxID=30076 RepID=A0A161M1A8_TRIIF